MCKPCREQSDLVADHAFVQQSLKILARCDKPIDLPKINDLLRYLNRSNFTAAGHPFKKFGKWRIIKGMRFGGGNAY